MSGKEIAREILWAMEVLVDVPEAEVTAVSMEVNKISADVADTWAPFPFAYTILALALAEVGARVRVGKVSTTMVDVGASLSFTDTLGGAGAKAGMRVVRELSSLLALCVRSW